jgi:glutathione S-transferase
MSVFLYHHHVSVCATKSRLALEEKEVPWDGELVDLRGSQQHKMDYLKINPFGLVPVLVHDDKVIPESTVINEYIDAVFDGPPLRPKDEHKLAQMRVWTRMLDENVHAAIGVLTTSIAYRHVPQHRKQISNQLDPYKKTRKVASFDVGIENPHFKTAIKRMDMLFGHMEEALGGKGPGRAMAGGGPNWLLGDYSLADLNFAPYIIRIDCLQLHFLYQNRPRVTAWYERLKARPAVQRAIFDWFKRDETTWTGLMIEQGKKIQSRAQSILDEARSAA